MILKDIYKAELGDIIVYKYIDWGALNLLSISPEIYKENKKILTEYIVSFLYNLINYINNVY